jgi:hypothetical protein
MVSGFVNSISLLLKCYTSNGYILSENDLYMSYEHIINEMFDDIGSLSLSNPNERLPKEEQIRSRMFASLIGESRHVSVERGYVPIEDGDSSECDLWIESNEGLETWVEIKRCWSAKGFNNKPKEQLRTWSYDISKLARLPVNTERYFILVGVFDDDPTIQPRTSKVLSNIDNFYSNNQIEFMGRDFNWRDSSINYVSCWVFKWKLGEDI